MAICTVTTPSLRGWKQGETVDLSGDVGQPGDPDVFNERTPSRGSRWLPRLPARKSPRGKSRGRIQGCSEHRSIQTQGKSWHRLTSAEGHAGGARVRDGVD